MVKTYIFVFGTFPKQTKLGGGNSNIFFLSSPLFGDFFFILTSIFFKGVGSTTNQKISACSRGN